MTTHILSTPLTDDVIRQLHVGDQVLLRGTIYMARDAAHKRLVALLHAGRPLPVDLRGQVVFYGGPGPAKPGHPLGVVSPTSAYRMDPYAPELYAYGVKAAIGKGNRGAVIRAACQKHCAVSLSAIGGLSATLLRHIKHAEIVAYEDLKAEAIQRLEIADFPLLVTNDSYGRDLFEEEVAKYHAILNPA
jgi:fumarate hydratase subunit beta